MLQLIRQHIIALFGHLFRASVLIVEWPSNISFINWFVAFTTQLVSRLTCKLIMFTAQSSSQDPSVTPSIAKRKRKYTRSHSDMSSTRQSHISHSNFIQHLANASSTPLINNQCLVTWFKNFVSRVVIPNYHVVVCNYSRNSIINIRRSKMKRCSTYFKQETYT